MKKFLRALPTWLALPIALTLSVHALAQCSGSSGVPFNCQPGQTPVAADQVLGGATTGTYANKTVAWNWGQVFNAGLATKALLVGDGRTRKDPTRQYGTGGKMQGKKFMISATWNAPAATFDNPDSVLFAGKGTAELFLPITSNYKFCGYDILPAFGIFDIFKNPDVPGALENYQRHLAKHCL